MILRKPYAFLIRNFKKIHITLLCFMIYVFYKTLEFQGFVREYKQIGVYNPYIEPVSNFTNPLFYFACLFIVVICGIMIYLLFFKKKPTFLYYIMIIEYIFIVIAFGFGASYFNTIGNDLINVQKLRIVTDLLFMAAIPQYILLVLILVRSFGIDLKRFGFKEDKEYLDIKEEDREEFEVEVNFDKDNFKREVRKKLRHFKYYYKEHQIYLNILIVIIVFIATGYSSYYFMVLKRAIKEGENFVANSYQIKINNSYITDKDFAGNFISTKNKFIILDVTVENKGSARTVNVERFHLTGAKESYTPTFRFNNYFKDLGTPYEKKELEHSGTENFLLIYEVDPEFTKYTYALYYQELKDFNTSKLRKIKIDTKDISGIKNVATRNLKEEMVIQDKAFTIQSYNIAQNIEYTYESCDAKNCKINTSSISASPNKTLLNLKYMSSDYTKQQLYDLVLANAKIYYLDTDAKMKSNKVIMPLSYKKYIGDQLFFMVDNAIVNATEIRLVFVYRNQEYVIRLK